MRAVSGSSTVLTTKSPVARMLRSVSLGSPPRRLIEMPIRGGRLVIALKYEKGATLKRPSGPTVLTNAIGRGTTTPIMKRYIAPGEIDSGSRIIRPD